MSWILEESLFVMVVGIVLTVGAGVAWLQTGYRFLLLFMAVTAGVTAALVLLERVVETDRERISDTLEQIARDLKSNDLNAVLKHVDPAATAAIQQAQQELPRYEFHHVDIKSNLKVDVIDEEPKRAEARFNVVVILTLANDSIAERITVPRYIELKLIEADDGRWLVTNYDHWPPGQGYRKSN